MVTSNLANTAIQQELERGERVLWSGMPRQGICFRSSDLFLVPFSLLWGGFAFFWFYMAAFGSKASTFATLWGIPFVLLGIYLIVGRFFLDSYLRSRTFYGVTNRRMLIVSGIWTRETKSIDLQRLSEVSLTERPDGSGNLYFGPVTPFYSAWYGDPWLGSSSRLPPSFQLIHDARRVYDLIRSAQREA